MGFELFASLGLDGSGYTRGLRHAEDESKQFGGRVESRFGGIGSHLQSAIAGAFGFEAIKGFGEQVIQNLASIKQLAAQYDLTTDEQQQLDASARKIGLTFENFGTVLRSINESRQQAIGGNREMVESYSRFGITVEDLTSKLRDLDIARRLGATTSGRTLDSDERAAFADLIGTRNQKMISALQNMDRFADAFTVDPETIEHMEDIHQKMGVAKKQTQGLFGTALSELLDGNIFAFTPENLLKIRMDQRQRAIEAADRDAQGAPGPGVFTALEREGKAHAFLGTPEEAKKLELKQTEAELEKALLKLEFEKLTPKQQELRLQEEINSLKKDAAELQKSGADIDKSFANVNLKMAAEKELQLLALTKKDKSEPAPLITDALARVGGFGASAGGETVGVLKESRDHLRQIRENTRASASGGYP